MMKRKLAGMTALMLAAALMAAGCGKKEAETEATQPQTEVTVATETETETESETEFVVPEGKAISHLTGEIVDEAVNNRRPVAVMINNVPEALPQYGIGQADILYEAVVEADLTRQMAVFSDISAVEKIGPIRSCRDYYLDFAHDDNAIYTHFGWSTIAEWRIKNEGLKTINLMFGTLDDTYYRSKDRVAPHNVFSSGEMLKKAIDVFDIDEKMPEDYEGRLKFNYKDTELQEGESADTVNISFSSKCQLKYDKKNKIYEKYEFDDKQIDALTDEVLKFKNIIIQYAGYVEVSDMGHKNIDLANKGKGMYITDGKAIDITWEKKDYNTDVTHYYTEDGKPLKLNPGKSYIAVIPTDYTVTLS